MTEIKTMSNLKIHSLKPIGNDFFTDSESYLSELTEEETNVTGGIYTSYRWIWNPPIRISRFFA